jgi:dCTP deaminase
MLLVDYQIRNLCVGLSDGQVPMIEPYSPPVSGSGIISYGETSAGYDLRLAPEVLIFKNSYGEAIDPKRFKDDEYRNRMFDKIYGGLNQAVIIPAHSYILGMSYEYIRMPRNLKARCVGKSTLARCGILVNTTPLEPEWHGYLTIEISNSSPCPAKIYCMEGIAQVEFEVLSSLPEQSYQTKGGKYQGQLQVTPAMVK